MENVFFVMSAFFFSFDEFFHFKIQNYRLRYQNEHTIYCFLKIIKIIYSLKKFRISKFFEKCDFVQKKVHISMIVLFKN